MDPTDVIASDPQVWLLALKRFETGTFDILIINLSFPKLFIL